MPQANQHSKKTLADLVGEYIDSQHVCTDINIQAITNDSREVMPGTLFLAFPGEQVDGRDYVSQAEIQGAAAICYEATHANVLTEASIPFIPISNLKQKQALIAARFYDVPSKKIPVIGVTGTNGKTSCVQFIAQAFNPGKKCAVIGTTGYGFLPNLTKTRNTTPDGLMTQKLIADCVDRGADILTMEVSSHGLVENRVDGVSFNTAVFTQLSRDHLDFHGTMEKYQAAKELLFQQPGLQHAVINVDNAAGKYFAKKYKSKLRVLTFSLNQKSHADIVVMYSKAKKIGFDVSVKTPWGVGSFYCPLMGEFNIENVLAVLGVLGIFKIPLNEIFHRLSQLKTVPGRMNLYEATDMPHVVVDYAHTPDALSHALKALQAHCQGDLWCVFGCGGDRDHGKRAEMGAIAAQLSDHVVITNDNPRHEAPMDIVSDIQQKISDLAKVSVELDRAIAIQTAIREAKPSDIVLVAGKGHETKQIIGPNVIPFNDGECIQKRMQKRPRR